MSHPAENPNELGWQIVDAMRTVGDEYMRSFIEVVIALDVAEIERARRLYEAIPKKGMGGMLDGLDAISRALLPRFERGLGRHEED